MLAPKRLLCFAPLLVAALAETAVDAQPTDDRSICLELGNGAVDAGFSLTLAVGDQDDDARDELAAGLPYWSDPKFPEFERQGGFFAYRRSSAPPNIWSSTIGGLYGNDEDQVGAALASGDFDDDGSDDFVVGVPVAVGGHVLIARFGEQAVLLAQGVDGIAGGAEPGDLFGSAFAVGNFDGDDYADLAIGVPGESWSEASGDHQGAVQLFYGSATGLDGTRDLLFGQHLFTGQTREDVDQFGRSLAAGDFDGDGFDDLAIGVPDENEGASIDSGIVHVVFGSVTGLDFTRQQTWSQSSSGVGSSPEEGDRFGEQLAIGDFDADGRDDLAIGTPQESDGAIGAAGVFQILYGSASGPTAVGTQLVTRPGGSIANGRFGARLLAADLDGDGADDLAVIASSITSPAPPGYEAEGELQLFFGAVGAPLRASGRAPSTPDSGACHESAFRSTAFGSGLTAGDFDGDGALDLAIGIAEWYPVESFDSFGAALVLFGSLFSDGFDTGDAARWSATAP